MICIVSACIGPAMISMHNPHPIRDKNITSESQSQEIKFSCNLHQVFHVNKNRYWIGTPPEYKWI